jgi:hypothetical protein
MHTEFHDSLALVSKSRMTFDTVTTTMFKMKVSGQLHASFDLHPGPYWRDRGVGSGANLHVMVGK